MISKCFPKLQPLWVKIGGGVNLRGLRVPGLYIILVSTVTFISSSITTSGQPSCKSQNSLNNILQEKKTIDTLWRSSVDNAIKYYIFLNKELLPSYWNLQTEIFVLIENEDLKTLQDLKREYNDAVDSLLQEFKSTNEIVYKNIMATSNIHNLIIVENFRSFPDVYAILLNPTVLHRIVSSERLSIVQDLYTKYRPKVKPFEPCIKKFKKERTDFVEKNMVPQIMQGLGIKSDEETELSELVDILLWVAN